MNKKYHFTYRVWPKMLIKIMLLCSIFIPTYSSKETHKTTARIRISWSSCRDWTRLLCGYNGFVSLFLSRMQLISERYSLVFFFFRILVLLKVNYYRTKTILALKLRIPMEFFFSWLKHGKDSESWDAYLLTYTTEEAHKENFSSEILSEII